MSRSIYLIPLFAFFVLACGNKEAAENTTNVPEKDTAPEVKKPELQAYDTLLTDASKFIAGVETSHYLKGLQSEKYYEEHRKFTNDSWKVTTDSMLEPIKKWTSEKNIGDDRDSVLCFYPLSGPDFLYGNVFFPNADNYILLGLEPRGSMVDFRNLKEEEIKKYLDGIRKSMRYLNSRGYFVTSHMSGDFSKSHLNGMVHMMLYMMARTGHPVVDVYNIIIDSTGEEKRLADNEKAGDNIQAVKIEFLSPDTLEKRNAYYFKLDASDENLNKHPEFASFVNSFGNRVAYMKSASCVLHNTNFDVMRKLVLNSDKLLQDDTGVPLRYIQEDTTLQVEVYGTYTNVINDLKWCYQPSLRKLLESSGNNQKLPFRISYNGNFGEGMLLWAVKKR